MLKNPFNFNLCTTVEYVHLSVSDKEMESVREILRGNLNLTTVEFQVERKCRNQNFEI